MRTTSIRFTGLASGLDTESLVENMILPYKNKVDSAQQSKTLMDWKKDAWRDMNSKLSGFYNNYVSKARLESTYNKRSISVSNTNAIEVRGNSTLPEGTHTINEIVQLAESAKLNTAIIKNKDGKIASKSTVLKDLKSSPISSPNDRAVLKVNDGDTNACIAITEDMTIETLEKALKENLKNSNVSFDETAGAFFISSKKTGENQSISVEAYNYNLAEGEIKETKLTPDRQNSSILYTLGLTTKEDTASVKGVGENAKFFYNGVLVESETNNISVNGFNFTIKGKPTEPITITSTFDTEAVVSYVKEFIEEYNKLIGDIQTKLDATSAKGYDPLTDEQKKAMSDYEIEQWETKIKESLFRKDSDLEKLLTDMRGVFGGEISGDSFKTLSQIGITTGAWNEKGKLYIDEDKLRAAVNNDAQGVIDLFSKNGKTEEETGYVDRLYDMLTKQTKSSEMRTAYSFYNDKLLTKKITAQEELIEKLQERMDSMEDMYYSRFTAMEKMMSQLNSQSDYLTSMLGGS